MQQAWLRNQACLPVQLLEPERECEKIDGEGIMDSIEMDSHSPHPFNRYFLFTVLSSTLIQLSQSTFPTPRS